MLHMFLVLLVYVTCASVETLPDFVSWHGFSTVGFFMHLLVTVTERSLGRRGGCVFTWPQQPSLHGYFGSRAGSDWPTFKT